MTEHERSFAESMERRGWRVLKNGWPDFLLYNPVACKALAVEFKSANDKLRAEQEEMHKWLRKMGLPVYVARSDFDPTTVFKASLMTPGALKIAQDRVCNLRSELKNWMLQCEGKLTQLQKQMEEAVIINEN